MVLQTKTPSRVELVKRAADVVPLLRERSLWIDENRRLPDDVIAALEDSGLLKMQLPTQYGGYESDARSLVDVHAELAKGDNSAAFCVSVWALLNWMAGLWPDSVQEEVFGANPNARVCGTLALGGTAARVDGGWLFNGSWRFNSAVLHSHWKITAAMADDGSGPVTALIPVPDFRIVDDWHTNGLPGSGSVTTVAENVFVPAERVIATMDFFTDQCKSETNKVKPGYQVPMLVTSTAATAGQLIGSAKYVLETFLDRLDGRSITYTDYTSQREAPVTHLQVGEAALLIEEAETRAHLFADLITEKMRTNEEWTQQERVRSRVQLGRVAQLCKQAVDIIAMASGGSSIFREVPITRVQRDVHAVSIHALTHPGTNIELYGRVLCGLEPNTPYL
ncbi:acyl-CoA dehydrogenase family protein [Saccharothrix luteola]|uniref:acyl-CoA dehydrogenase family protein n=1 Tax=Saccharothrix luteola TaxID=2893018 RepID=UPI001E327148|nr:acyl-CoA dehydrogenase family protein [Saccharothrix luteola]MCC8245907.1 acyl-CoA dehydrogenase family protein [Saccharothrix luteola]MCC8248333.1 acyl-CoA dehydrogenase family protein [Saccharothrix luteola]